MGTMCVPRSSRPRNAGGRSFRRPGSTSSRPIGMYLCWNESDSHRYRRAVLTPAVSDPKWLSGNGVSRLVNQVKDADQRRTSLHILRTSDRASSQTSKVERASETNHLSYEIQALARTDVPLPPLLDFCEDPRLDKGASSNHDTIYSALLDARPVSFGRKAITASEYRYWGYCWRWRTHLGTVRSKRMNAQSSSAARARTASAHWRM